jgi:hypothetical protein
MSGHLQLSNLEPLAKGHSRLVFQHPERADWLVKVIRPDVVESRFGSGAAWYKRRRRFGRYLSYVRESQEYIAVWTRHGSELPFLQKVVGFATTDLGLGLVIGAARDRDGNLAPTLGGLIASKRFDAKARGDLEVFLDRLLGSEVIISDLNVGNMVYAHDESQGDHFVLIDGMGNNTIWPLKAISRRINRRSKLGRFRKLRRKIEFLLEMAAERTAIP